jgi:hypothetical protein
MIYHNDFEQSSGDSYRTEPIAGNKSLIVDKDRQVSPDYYFLFDGDKARWIRVQATFRSKDKEWYLWSMTQFVVRLIDTNKVGHDRIIKENMIRVQRQLDNGEAKEISLDMKLPRQHYDSVSISFWNAGSSKELVIDNLKAWKFTK